MLNIYWRGGFFRGMRFSPLRIIGLSMLGFGLLFSAIAGIIFLGSGFFQVQKYVQGQCTITEKHLESEISTQKDSNGRRSSTLVYRPSFTYQVRAADGRVYIGYRYEFSEVSTSDRGGEQAKLDRYQMNSVYPCWYDPGDPAEAVLERSVGTGNWILMGGFLGFGLLFAILGIVLTVKGAVRRDAGVSYQQEQIFSTAARSSQSGSILPPYQDILGDVNEAFSSGKPGIGDAMLIQGSNQLWMPESRLSPAEREDTMSEMNQLVERYMTVWNVTDPKVRRELISELWAEDGVQFLSSQEYRGHEALEERVTSAHEEFVEKGGHVFRRANDVESHHNVVKLDWEMVPAGGGKVAGTGTVFLLLNDDGLIQFDYQF